METAVLSPHYDDAVLAAFSLLQQEEPIRVITVFGGAPGDPDALGPFVAEFLADCGLPLDARAANEIRRNEDRSALRRAGAAYHHLMHPEALYRVQPDGRPLIKVEADLYDSPLTDNDAITERIAQELERLLREVDAVVLPLGNGGHIDHRITRDVGERVAAALGLRTIWYAEPTYGGAVAAELVPPGAVRQTCHLHDPIWRRKRSAIQAYESQLRMFGSANADEPDHEFWEPLRSEVFYVEAGHSDRDL